MKKNGYSSSHLFARSRILLGSYHLHLLPLAPILSMSLYNEYSLERPDSIRLVTLHSAATDTGVELSMITAALSTKPNYLALSYTWGNPMDELHPSFQEFETAARYIKCSGRNFQIHQNLYDTLWQLREKQEYTPLWIDAICIDQGNYEERNSQLALMPSIYAEASSVIIWLGKDDETTEISAHTLGGLRNNGAFILQSMDFSNRSVGLYGSFSRQQRQALVRLLRRRWFIRLWTLQEVILARNTRCLCGPYELDVQAIGMVAADMHRYVSTHSEANIPTDLGGLSFCQLGSTSCISAWSGLNWPASGFGSRAFLRYPKIDHKNEIPRTSKWLVALELLVHEARHRNCSNLEDKVLAPLAFALYERFTPQDPDFFYIGTQARDLLDHRVPVAELYPKFTLFMIESMESLDILSRSQSDNGHIGSVQEPKLPSWVPPFQKAGTSSLIDDLLFTRYEAARYLGPYKRFECKISSV